MDLTSVSFRGWYSPFLKFRKLFAAPTGCLFIFCLNVLWYSSRFAAPGLAQLQPKLAPVGHVWLKLGQKRSRWTPNWSHLMHMDIHVSSNMRQLGTFWRQLRTKLGSRRHNMGNLWEHCPKRSVIDSKKAWKTPVKTGVLRISLGRLCPHFEACRLQLGQKLLPNGSKLGQVAPSWSQVGPKLDQVGLTLGPCRPKLTPSRANVAAMSDRNGPFGRFWADLQNVQITAPGNRLLRVCPGRTCPPSAEAAPD